MAARATVRGFTLVELLVAIAIFGLVVGVASYGFSLFSRHWDGRRGDFERAQGEYQRLDLVNTALQDTLPWVVRGEKGALGFYFLGREEGLTLVTDSPVFSPGRPAVIRLFREPETSGSWKLVYEEAPLDKVLLRRADQVLPFSYRMVVAQGLSKIEFRYFGWESLDVRLAAADNPEPGRQPGWSGEFDGILRHQHPQRIGLRLGGGETVLFVPERASIAFGRYMVPE
jgi:prepilin-type N-terminal cleavage/methylation domain-containing protein